MKRTRSILALLLVIALIPFLSSCGKDGGEGTKEAGTTKKSKNEVYETELLSVEVPKGWKALPQTDKADSAYIYKGDNAYDSPSVSITYRDPDTEMLSPKGMYSDAEDMDPVKIGDYTWEGFTATSAGSPITILSVKEPHQLQVDIFNEVGDQKISLEDDDVQLIIRSITIK